MKSRNGTRLRKDLFNIAGNADNDAVLNPTPLRKYSTIRGAPLRLQTATPRRRVDSLSFSTIYLVFTFELSLPSSIVRNSRKVRGKREATSDEDGVFGFFIVATPFSLVDTFLSA